MIKKHKTVLISSVSSLLTLAGMSYAAIITENTVPRKDSSALDNIFQSAVASLQAQPHNTPEEATVSVLKHMREKIRFQPGFPAARGAHEWNGRRALAEGGVNGCVESAKVFFELFHAAYPMWKEVYLDSFNAAGDGGHAVVEVTGSDGQGYIVDAMSFTNLPGRIEIDEGSLSGPADAAKKHTGRVLQFKERSDAFLEKKGGKYRMSIYPYGQVFNGALQSDRAFDTLEELNLAVNRYNILPRLDFRYLKDHGHILPYVDTEKSGFIYLNSYGGLSKHVIYSCHTRLPERDDAEKIEPAARKNYEQTGKTGTCDWAKTE